RGASMSRPLTFILFILALTAQLSRADDSPLKPSIANAVQHDQQVLQSDPKNKEALNDIVDQLDGAGHWKDALPYLATLNEVQPNDAARAHQLGMYYSWSDNGSAKALPLLRHASELQPANSQYAYDYADVLARGSENRAQS